jgi:aminocarboxymuconate-semialdehyde decarboxylase
MIIDVHAHYVSPNLVAEAKNNGAAYGVRVDTFDDGREAISFLHSGVRLRPFFKELCDLTDRVAYLDSLGIDVQVVSAWTDMSGDDLAPEHGARWARLQNDTMAEAVSASGGRFEAMGTLPMQAVAGAINELEYIVHRLGIRSIELGSHANGKELDHPDYRPLWKRLAELDVLVLLHPPFRPVGLDRTGDYFLNNLISFPVDTTIAASRLIFSGTLSDLPDLKICLAHAGGFLPYQIGRLDRGYAAHPACKKITRPPHEFLRSFYYDTLTHDDAALDYLRATVGPDRLVYGSDYPFEMLDESGTKRVWDMKGISEAEREAILGLTGRALLGEPTEHARAAVK